MATAPEYLDPEAEKRERGLEASRAAARRILADPQLVASLRQSVAELEAKPRGSLMTSEQFLALFADD